MSVGPGYQIVISRPAAKSFEDLTESLQKRIAAAIEALGKEPRPQGVEKLSGRKDQYRIRVGDYRIVYTIQDKLLIVLILQIGNRRDIYRKGGKR
jgi:mRNA interferase RelE/StbE